VDNDSFDTPQWLQHWTGRIDSWFGIAANIVIDIMALFSLVALVYSTFQVGFKLWKVVSLGGEAELTAVIVEILTVFILVEVLAVSVRFLRANRIEIRDLIDVTLAILFREIWVGVFAGELHWQELISLAVLVIAIGGLRVALTRQAAVLPSITTPGTKPDRLR
jgi:uncharacterized membrane protein (DUF373 family)